MNPAIIWRLVTPYDDMDTQEHELSVKPHKPAGLHVVYELPSSFFMATTSILKWLAKPTKWLASRNAGRGRVMPPKSTPTPEISQSARAQATFASQKVNSRVAPVVMHLHHLEMHPQFAPTCRTVRFNVALEDDSTALLKFYTSTLLKEVEQGQQIRNNIWIDKPRAMPLARRITTHGGDNWIIHHRARENGDEARLRGSLGDVLQ
ncbi:hypothetical protein DFH09DRAFT_1088816 [Mycena vulgaris]|nr:hypothetical protein DFH09DRAFT_1088816 [Mycena vulgaris]